MNKEKEEKYINAVIILSMIVVCLIFMSIFVFYAELKPMEKELYCGSRIIKYEPVYNESANHAFPIGYRCCPKEDRVVLDNSTGLWSKDKNDGCYYVPR